MNRTTLMVRSNEFIHEVLVARDKLAKIASGQVERGKRVCQYDAKTGIRPMKPAEARQMAQHIIARLNVAINKFQDSEPRSWEWDGFENRYE